MNDSEKLAAIQKSLGAIELACCYGLEEDIDAREAMLREILKHTNEAIKVAET